jgi:hypothetical protein
VAKSGRVAGTGVGVTVGKLAVQNPAVGELKKKVASGNPLLRALYWSATPLNPGFGLSIKIDRKVSEKKNPP